jgi:hypothetical protein
VQNSEDRQRQRACATEYLLPLKIGRTETLQTQGGAFVIDTGRKTVAGHRRRMAVPERLLSATKPGPAGELTVFGPPASWPGGTACAATLTLAYAGGVLKVCWLWPRAAAIGCC